jgi:TRAP-type C4-dicarboxylate transport system substrate-binding protein
MRFHFCFLLQMYENLYKEFENKLFQPVKKEERRKKQLEVIKFSESMGRQFSRNRRDVMKKKERKQSTKISTTEEKNFLL